MYEPSNFLGRDNVFATLKDQGRNVYLGQVRAVIRSERYPGKGFGDFRISSAETVRKFFT